MFKHSLEVIKMSTQVENKMEKSVKDSLTVMTQIVLPRDTNNFGSLYGGKLLDWIDIVGSTVAMRHADHRVVTASIDSLHFLHPVRRGDIVILTGRINYVGRTSMEIEVNVEAENPLTDERKKTCTAYLTYVAVDEGGNPVPVSRLKLVTADEELRWKQAIERRKVRLEMRNKLLKEP